MRFSSIVSIFALLLLGNLAFSAPISDPFDSIDPSWVTDRTEPQSFVSTVDPTNALNNVLQITTSPTPFSNVSTFYNTQGRQRPVNIGASGWYMSADVLVTADMVSDTGPMRRTDLWGRDSEPVEANANYPIFGLTNASPTDAFNQAAGDRTARYRVWDGNTVNGWVDLGTPTVGWHNLYVAYTGTALEYFVDGNSVYTDPTVSLTNGALQTTFLQAYNFGQDSYTVTWDNLNTQVPEPTGIAAIGIMTLGLFRRQRA